MWSYLLLGAALWVALDYGSFWLAKKLGWVK